MYVCQLSLLHFLIGDGYNYKDRLPEAMCCTCSVNVVLLLMCYMYIPAFIVTSAAISQLWVFLCLRLFVVVYTLVMFMERG